MLTIGWFVVRWMRPATFPRGAVSVTPSPAIREKLRRSLGSPNGALGVLLISAVHVGHVVVTPYKMCRFSEDVSMCAGFCEVPVAVICSFLKSKWGGLFLIIL